LKKAIYKEGFEYYKNNFPVQYRYYLDPDDRYYPDDNKVTDDHYIYYGEWDSIKIGCDNCLQLWNDENNN